MRDKPRAGRAAEAVTPTTVVNVEVLVNKGHSELQEVANQFRISKLQHIRFYTN